MTLIRSITITLLVAIGLPSQANAADKLTPEQLFSRGAEFTDVKISPEGDYISAITKHDGKKKLLILDSKTNKLTHAVFFPGNAQVRDYVWANDERIVLQIEHLKGWQDHPLYYGELFAVNADGSRPIYLFGHKSGGQQTGSHIKQNTPMRATAYILDPLPEDKKYILIKALPWGHGGSNWQENTQKVFRVNLYSGKRKKIASAPIPNANFLTDNDGEVRFVSGTRDYINYELFYRQDSKWVNVDKLTHNLNNLTPIAFGDDKDSLYVTGSESGKPEGVYLLNIKTGKQKLISQDNVVDPSNFWINKTSKKLYAVEYENGYPEYEFIAPKDPSAKYIKQLLASLPGHQIHLVSQTNDAEKMIIKAFNDRNPGDYYLFDSKAVNLAYLFSEKKWLDPDQMAEVKPVKFTSRDGIEINGYLTLPYGVDAKNLPLVVNPHGGPHGPRDWWGFDPQNQLIASQGAAVLQVNFRGSGGYGADFEHAGHQKWGTNIQYDIIDATKYVIEQGIVDKERVCIAGGSFGGYSALQSAIIEPDLFKCAIGFAGVYDLPLMFEEGDVQGRRAGERYLKQVLGEDEQVLKAMSPTHNVDKLKAKLLLVHGGDDERAPIEQFEALEEALKKHNYPFQQLVMDDEGHGFYNDEHRAKYFGEMMGFLKKNLKL
ncbi:alpha/beta hydrolase family protein [Shewanella nanhaiensis]|uniref:S9 family peptidase n=1 Tax=Shewanella nanhaiensis TaxID=2864872 RepID=A0ABS7E827_9GAMM|nr:S9 family peptidase [Shewanella nanhaiensis]MBW8185719.1 S9 family peptidase [Shewanella nanhaiensis]